MTPKQVFEDPVRLQELSEQKKLRDQNKESENISEAMQCESEDENIKKSSAKKVKTERKQINFYAKASEVKWAMILKRPMIILMYKEALLNTNQLHSSLPGVVVSFLQGFEDVFPEEIPHGLPPIRGIEHRIWLE